MRKILLGHPLGNPNSREVALSLHEHGLLEAVATAFSYNEGSRLGRVVAALPTALAGRLQRQLQRRAWLPPGLPRLTRFEPYELACSAGLGLAVGARSSWLRRRFANSLFYSFDMNLAAAIRSGAGGNALGAVYLYEDGASKSFEAARARGLRCLYDLPVASHRYTERLMADEADTFPEFRMSLVVEEPSWKRERKERELQLADHIFVASKFVARTLGEVSPDKVSIVPYGAPIGDFVPTERDSNCFRALFVGRVGPRKGIHYLLRAWEESGLRADQLVLVGLDEFPVGWMKQHLVGAEYRTPLPHRDLVQLYQGANVFVFPSLADGFGLVLLEAMACGLPIIATENTGAADIIEHGREGFLVPIRDSEAIAERLVWCKEHPQELAEMGRAARRRAEELSWRGYRERFAQAVLRALQSERSSS